MKSVNEQVAVDVREVDSIHGAKPEPEERPAFTQMQIEGGTKADVADGQLELSVPRSTSIESTVQELADLEGKYCRNCRRFNLKLGQIEIERMGYRGDEQERKVVMEMAAFYAENDRETPVYVDSEDGVFAPTLAETEMARTGLCTKLKVLVHPDCHCAGPEEGCGEVWEALNSDVAREVQERRDAIYGTAAGTR